MLSECHKSLPKVCTLDFFSLLLHCFVLCVPGKLLHSFVYQGSQEEKRLSRNCNGRAAQSSQIKLPQDFCFEFFFSFYSFLYLTLPKSAKLNCQRFFSSFFNRFRDFLSFFFSFIDVHFPIISDDSSLESNY